MDERKDEIIVGNPTETLLDEQKDVVNAIEENTIDSDSQDVENDVENNIRRQVATITRLILHSME